MANSRTKSGRFPTESIYWKDIPAGSKVTYDTAMYIVTLPSGKKAVAYWYGQKDFDDAKVWLRRAEALTSKRGK